MTIRSRAFVPIDAEPLKAIEDRFKCLGDVSFFVRIVDAKNELPAMFASEEPVKKGRADSADVKIPRRTRGETCANHVIADFGFGNADLLNHNPKDNS